MKTYRVVILGCIVAFVRALQVAKIRLRIVPFPTSSHRSSRTRETNVFLPPLLPF
jgi:hypothetical protein